MRLPPEPKRAPPLQLPADQPRDLLAELREQLRVAQERQEPRVVRAAANPAVRSTTQATV